MAPLDDATRQLIGDWIAAGANRNQSLEGFFAAFKAQDTSTMEALSARDFVIHEADGLPYAGTS